MIKNLRPPSTQIFMARTHAFIEASTAEKMVPVSNASLLKNPANNQLEPVPERGQRPLRKVGDVYGNYIVTTKLESVPVSNMKLLQPKLYNKENNSIMLRKTEPVPVPSAMSKEYRKLLNFNALPAGYALNKGPKKIELAFLEKLTNDNAKRVVLEFMKNSLAGSIYRPLRMKFGDANRNALAKEAYDSALQEMLEYYQKGITQGTSINLVIDKFMGNLRAVYNTPEFDVSNYVDKDDIEKSIQQLMELSHSRQDYNDASREDPNGSASKADTVAILQAQIDKLRASAPPDALTQAATDAIVTQPAPPTNFVALDAAAVGPLSPAEIEKLNAASELLKSVKPQSAGDTPVGISRHTGKPYGREFTATGEEGEEEGSEAPSGDVFLGRYGDVISGKTSRASSIGDGLSEEQQTNIQYIGEQLGNVITNNNLSGVEILAPSIANKIDDPDIASSLIHNVVASKEQATEKEDKSKLDEIHRALFDRYTILTRAQSERKPSSSESKSPNVEPYSEGRQPLTPFVRPSIKPSQAGPAETPSRKPSQAGPEEQPEQLSEKDASELLKKGNDETQADYDERIKFIKIHTPEIIYITSEPKIKKAVDLYAALKFTNNYLESMKVSNTNIGKVLIDIARPYKKLYFEINPEAGRYFKDENAPNEADIDRNDPVNEGIMSKEDYYQAAKQNLLRDYGQGVRDITDAGDPSYKFQRNQIEPVWLINRVFPQGKDDPRIIRILSGSISIQSPKQQTPASSRKPSASAKKSSAKSSSAPNFSEEIDKLIASSEKKSSRKPSQAGEAKEEEEKYDKPAEPKPVEPKKEAPALPQMPIGVSLNEHLAKSLNASGAFDTRKNLIRDFSIMNDKLVFPAYSERTINNLINDPNKNNYNKVVEIKAMSEDLREKLIKRKISKKMATTLIKPNNEPIIGTDDGNRGSITIGQTVEQALNTDYVYLMRYIKALKANKVPLIDGRGRKRRTKKEKVPKLSQTKKEYDLSTQKFMKQGREGKVPLPKELTQPSSIARGATKFSNDELNRIIAAILSDRS